MDEVFLAIHSEWHDLWRAVDQDGNVLDIFVQRRRDKHAAKKFFRMRLKGLAYIPRVIIIDQLKSYGAAKRELLPSVEPRQHRSLNNRAENSHQPTQLAVYQRSVPRLRLRPTDRLLWAWLARLWSGWQDGLAFMQPRKVIAWQRKRFRDHWRRFSQQGKPGRPLVVKEIQALIKNMSQANPMWGSARIVGSCASWASTWRHRP